MKKLELSDGLLVDKNGQLKYLLYNPVRHCFMLVNVYGTSNVTDIPWIIIKELK